MNYTENYHDWLRDAHAMEKQAESMLEKMADRLEHYPNLKARIVQHLDETRQQQHLLSQVIDRNNVSRSVLKDAMGKMTAFGQSVSGMMMPDEVVKGVISSYVFEQFEIGCYLSLIAAAELAGDKEGADVFRQILEQEKAMAEWVGNHISEVTEQFLIRSAQPDTEAKK